MATGMTQTEIDDAKWAVDEFSQLVATAKAEMVETATILKKKQFPLPGDEVEACCIFCGEPEDLCFCEVVECSQCGGVADTENGHTICCVDCGEWECPSCTEVNICWECYCHFDGHGCNEGFKHCNCGSEEDEDSDVITATSAGHPVGVIEVPPWITRGDIEAGLLQANDITVAEDPKTILKYWGYDYRLFDPVVSAASLWLAEPMAHRAMPGFHPLFQDDPRVAELCEEGAAVFARLVDEADFFLSRYIDMAVGGELRHHVAVRSTLSGTRAYAWTGWKMLRERIGAQALADAGALFRDFTKKGYGGELWGLAADVRHLREIGTLSPWLFVERIWTMEHNAGSMLNKVSWAYMTTPNGLASFSGLAKGLKYIKTTVGPAHSATPTNWAPLVALSSPEVGQTFLRQWREYNIIRRDWGLSALAAPWPARGGDVGELLHNHRHAVRTAFAQTCVEDSALDQLRAKMPSLCPATEHPEIYWYQPLKHPPELAAAFPGVAFDSHSSIGHAVVDGASTPQKWVSLTVRITSKYATSKATSMVTAEDFAAATGVDVCAPKVEKWYASAWRMRALDGQEVIVHGFDQLRITNATVTEEHMAASIGGAINVSHGGSLQLVGMFGWRFFEQSWETYTPESFDNVANAKLGPFAFCNTQWWLYKMRSYPLSPVVPPLVPPTPVVADVVDQPADKPTRG